MQGTRCAKFHPALDIPHAELILRKGYDAHIDSYSAARATPCLPQEIRPRAKPGDPVFFAPDRPDDVPRKITEEHLRTETLAAMKRADTPPAIVYHGAGEGNRTLVSSLGSYSSTIELRPR